MNTGVDVHVDGRRGNLLTIGTVADMSKKGSPRLAIVLALRNRAGVELPSVFACLLSVEEASSGRHDGAA